MRSGRLRDLFYAALEGMLNVLDSARSRIDPREPVRTARMRAAQDFSDDKSRNHHFIPRSMLRVWLESDDKIPTRDISTGKRSRQTIGAICREIELNVFSDASGGRHSAEQSFARLCDKPISEGLKMLPASNDMYGTAGMTAAAVLLPGIVCVAMRVQHAHAVVGAKRGRGDPFPWARANLVRVLADQAMGEWLWLFNRDAVAVTAREASDALLLSDAGPLLDSYDSSSWTASSDPRPWNRYLWFKARRPPRNQAPRHLRLRLAVRVDLLLSWEVVDPGDGGYTVEETLSKAEVAEFNADADARAIRHVFGPAV